MLRAFLRLFSSAPQPPKLLQDARSKPSVMLTARVDAGQPPECQPATRQPDHVDHRVRIMAMRLEHTRLCSDRRCERLRALGILTAGDMAAADPGELAKEFTATRKATVVLKQYRRAIRLAAAIPGMMPRDAQLLISIHRRSIRGLAREKPGVLYRDLQRFAESSSGRRQLRGRRLPSTRRIRRWISTCETYVSHSPAHVTAA